MTSAAIEWRATNLVALGEELQDRIARVTRLLVGPRFIEEALNSAQRGVD